MWTCSSQKLGLRADNSKLYRSKQIIISRVLWLCVCKEWEFDWDSESLSSKINGVNGVLMHRYQLCLLALSSVWQQVNTQQSPQAQPRQDVFIHVNNDLVSHFISFIRIFLQIIWFQIHRVALTIDIYWSAVSCCSSIITELIKNSILMMRPAHLSLHVMMTPFFVP